MSRVRLNVVSNLAANAWGSLISLVFVPIYIHYLGMESWGLIGFFVTLQNLLLIADMGLSTTLNREFARTSATEMETEQRRDLLRTLEIVYWSIALLVGGIVIAGAPFLAGKWLHIRHLSTAAVTESIMLMGVVGALQMPLGLYSGGLLGLQQQVRLNVINIVLWTSRSIGGVAVLAFIAATPVAYFVWQAVTAGIHTAIVAAVLWRSLGRAAAPARFRRNVLAETWRFTAGMTGITITGTLFNQIDKIVLSRILTLEIFGYYTLAAVVAGGLYRAVYPLFTAFFPRFTELLALDDREGLRRTYHSAVQLTIVLLVPVASVIALFSREVLLLWTRNAMTADRAHMILTLLMAATALTGMALMPYALQLASGWTRLALATTTVSCVALAPSVAWMALRNGPVGAASVLVVCNAICAVAMVALTHRRLLPADQKRFYTEDVARPLVAALAVVLPARMIFPDGAPWLTQVVCIGAILLCAIAAAGLAAPAMRRTGEEMLERVVSLRRRAISVE